MPNTYACKLVSNPNVPIFLPRVCTLVLFILVGNKELPDYSKNYSGIFGTGLVCVCSSFSATTRI